MRTIQRLDPRDLTAMQQVQVLLRAAQKQEATEIGETSSFEQFPSSTAVTPRIYFGAFKGDELIGFIAVGPDPEPEQLSIELLVVAASHQRQGVANELLATVLAGAPGLAFSVQVIEHNKPALALYEAHGFQAYRRGELGPSGIPIFKLRRRNP